MLDVDLELRRGAFHLEFRHRFASAWTVLFGPSGAGKSTVLRLIAGLESADRGRIVLDDKTLLSVTDGVSLASGRRRLGFVAQAPALFPHMKVAANVAFGLGGLPPAVRRERTEEMLELVGAAHLAERMPKDLSGGEAQRVALARSLARHPRLLLLDEPFSALDGAASDALLARLQQWLLKHDVQTVLVTHDATDAFATNAEVALLENGRLVSVGPATNVLSAERERLMERLSL